MLVTFGVEISYPLPSLQTSARCTVRNAQTGTQYAPLNANDLAATGQIDEKNWSILV